MIQELSLQVTFLKYCGIFKNPSEKFRNIIFYQIFVIFCLFYVMLMIIVFMIESDDIMEVSESLAPVITCITASIKFLFLLMHSNDVFQMIDQIRKLNHKWRFTQYDTIIEDANNLDRFVLKSMTGSILLCAIGYSTIPIVRNAVNILVLHKNWEYEVPYNTTAYLYDGAAFPEYQLTYLIQMGKMFYSALLNIVVDTIFFGFCMNICAHFQILQNLLMEVELKEFINYHRDIINLASKLNKLYKFVIFLEYVVISAFLCVCAFRVVVSKDLAKVFTAAFHGIAGLIDLLIYSYGGQKIMDSALEVASDCSKMKKDYVFVILGTQHELKIEAFMYHASLPTFTVIMSRTMSLITMLQSFD